MRKFCRTWRLPSIPEAPWDGSELPAHGERKSVISNFMITAHAIRMKNENRKRCASIDLLATVEPPNNGHIGDENFVHCSEVVHSSEVEMYGQYIYRG